MTRIFIVCLAVIGLFHSAFAFVNCRNAKGATEQTICSRADLSVLDDKMDQLHFQATHFSNPQGRKEIRENQKRWSRQRKACRVSVECIKTLYESRVKELSKIVLAERATYCLTEEDCSSFKHYQSWWGMSPDACFDVEDNQYRMLLGDEHLSFWGGSCDLRDRKSTKHGFRFSAVCRGEDETMEGIVEYRFENAYTLRLFDPWEKNGLLLVRCPNELHLRPSEGKKVHQEKR